MFASLRRPVPQTAAPMFEVQLIDCSPVGMPLTVFTTEPLQVAGELMRDRDTRRWDVKIRALAQGERPV